MLYYVLNRVISLFFLIKQYIKQVSCFIKNLPVPLGTLVRKKVRQKLAAASSQKGLHHWQEAQQ
jgi:hypothetical protein